MKFIPKTAPTHTTDHAENAAHTVVNEAASKAREIEEKLRSTVESASDTIAEQGSVASEQIKTTLEKAEKFVNEKPVAATGIAFAAGLLAATLLSRKS